MQMSPEYVDQMQWHQTLGFARQACARVFRDGGTPADALKAFGFSHKAQDVGNDWSKAVEVIAERMCATSDKKAA
ncbi:MAG: hypothetical protein RIC14_09625 [Filomicrobium sp.]